MYSGTVIKPYWGFEVGERILQMNLQGSRKESDSIL